MLQTEEEKAVKVGYGRLLRMVAPDWAYIFAGVLASAILGCVMPVFALILGVMLNTPCYVLALFVVLKTLLFQFLFKTIEKF